MLETSLAEDINLWKILDGIMEAEVILHCITLYGVILVYEIVFLVLQVCVF